METHDQQDDPAADEPARHPWVFVVYAVLFAMSIPWYVPRGSEPVLWFGLPHWVTLSLLGTLGVSIFTVFVINRYWEEGAEPLESADGSDEARR